MSDNHALSTIFSKLTQLSKKHALLVTAPLLLFTVAVLRMFGRVWYCTCGYIELWHGSNWDSGNSQHISDWYTFSHLIHGFIFYWVLQKFFKKSSVGFRFIVALLIEVAWEILENSPMIIDRYRTTTLSLEYTGDSIINSVADIVACMVGFLLARKLPVWLSITLVLVFEAVALYMIRDNLFLNVLMIVYPLQAIKDWQLQ